MTESVTSLDPEASDLLTELVTIGVGRAAAALSELVGERVELTVPRVRLVPLLCPLDGARSPDGLLTDGVSTVVIQDFQGTVRGRASLAFLRSSALALGNLLSDSEVTTTHVDLEVGGILLEVGNIVLNAVLGSLSNEAALTLEYSLPHLFSDGPVLPRLLPQSAGEEHLLIADVEFVVRNRNIAGTLAIVFAGGCVDLLLSRAAAPVVAGRP